MKFVVIFCMGYPPQRGGIERYSQEVAKAYKSLGKEVIVITKSDYFDPFAVVDNIPVFSVKGSNQLQIFLRMLSVWFSIRKKLKVDFVHCTSWRLALPFHILFGKDFLVVSVHGLEVLNVPIYLKPLAKYILKTANVVVGVSKTAIDAGMSLASTNLSNHWISSFNGLTYREQSLTLLSSEKFKNIQERDLIIYSFCRLVERKNIIGAIKSIDILRRRGLKNFKYLIGGGGPLLESLRLYVAEMKLDHLIVFLGYLEEKDVINKYYECDIFLHPQVAAKDGKDIEGFGLTIADAMSFCCVPIVGVDGGPKEFVTHGSTGYIVDGHDHDSIADKIEYLINNRGEITTIGEAARIWSLDNLTWKNHVGDIISKFEEIGSDD
jgi:phosphatidylinositol alpha-1,6-mannosyltransferase